MNRFQDSAVKRNHIDILTHNACFVRIDTIHRRGYIIICNHAMIAIPDFIQ